MPTRLCIDGCGRTPDGYNRRCSSCRHARVPDPKPRKHYLQRRFEDEDDHLAYCCPVHREEDNAHPRGAPTSHVRFDKLYDDPIDWPIVDRAELAEEWWKFNAVMDPDERLFFVHTLEDRERIGSNRTRSSHRHHERFGDNYETTDTGSGFQRKEPYASNGRKNAIPGTDPNRYIADGGDDDTWVAGEMERGATWSKNRTFDRLDDWARDRSRDPMP